MGDCDIGNADYLGAWRHPSFGRVEVIDICTNALTYETLVLFRSIDTLIELWVMDSDKFYADAVKDTSGTIDIIDEALDTANEVSRWLKEDQKVKKEYETSDK